MKFFILFAICSLLFATPLHAEGISLGVYPPIFQIEATPPANIQAPLTIENQGNSEVNLKIELRPFKPSDQENGQIIYQTIEEARFADPLIFQKIQLLDQGSPVTSVVLSPKQKKELILLIQLPKDEPPSDYYFSVLFLTSDKKGESINSSQAVTGIASNVLLSIGQKGKIEGLIQEFSAPLFLGEGPVPITVRVKNKNEFFITPVGDIIIKNLFGQSVGRIDLTKTNVLAKSVRSLPATWNEKFLLGPYKASLTLSLSDSGPVLRRDIFFFALPANILLIAIITLLALSFIVTRVKSRI